jgi:Domain of unknown function (DUF4401)
MTVAELYSALATRGLVSESQTPLTEPDSEANVPPWYVQVLIGFSAWLAGLLLLAFVVVELREVLIRDSSWTILIVIGVCACIASVALYATLGARSQFAGQFALAVSFAGQLAIAGGLGESEGPRTAFWGMLFVEITLVFVMRNRLHRFLSSLGAVIAWALAMHQAIFGDLPWTAAYEPAPRGFRLIVSLVLWLLVWAPVAFAAIWLLRREAWWMARGRETVLRPVTHGLIAALSIAPVALHPSVLWFELGFHSTRDVEAGWVALWPLLAALLALLALALAFALRNRPLMGLAILFGLVEVSCFYYTLGTTLLIKSIVMLLLGAGLLAAAQWSRKAWT